MGAKALSHHHRPPPPPYTQTIATTQPNIQYKNCLIGTLSIISGTTAQQVKHGGNTQYTPVLYILHTSTTCTQQYRTVHVFNVHCTVTLYTYRNYVMCSLQGRQTRQNSGGVADLTKGGLQFFFNFYAIKISTF